MIIILCVLFVIGGIFIFFIISVIIKLLRKLVFIFVKISSGDLIEVIDIYLKNEFG